MTIGKEAEKGKSYFFNERDPSISRLQELLETHSCSTFKPRRRGLSSSIRVCIPYNYVKEFPST